MTTARERFGKGRDSDITADGHTTDGHGESWRVSFEVPVEALSGRRVHYTVMVRRDAVDFPAEEEGYVCGRCGRLMADADGWHTLPLPAHLPLPTLVCAPCHAVAAVVH